jgi:hypothetical protein
LLQRGLVKRKDKLAVEIYKDAAAPAMREIGGTLAGLVRVALSPVNFVVLTADEALRLAEEAVRERFERWRVPQDRVVTPPPEVAVPVVQALRLPGQPSELRAMYLNLLARAMDAQTAKSTHPAYADLIRQLTPLEARVVGLFAKRHRAIALLEVRRQIDTIQFETVAKHLSTLGAELAPPTEVPRDSMDNLARLGIIDIRTDQHLEPQGLYEPIERSTEAARARQTIELQSGTVAYHRYLAEVTDFGLGFVRAVTELPDELPGKQ